jgi:hypothetical protein
MYRDGGYLGRLPIMTLAASPKGVFVPLGQIVTGRIDLRFTLPMVALLDRDYGVSIKHREVVAGLFFNVVMAGDQGPQ